MSFSESWVVGNTGHVTEHNNLSIYLNKIFYNVRSYGAVGNGVTDDTAAIASAIADMTAAGGVLYFPYGNYKTTGGFTIQYPTIIQGAGMAELPGLVDYGTQITCSSTTESLFTITAMRAAFRDISLVNNAEDAPTDGAGITVNIGDGLGRQKVDYQNISVTKFFIDVDTQSASTWVMDNCLLFSPVKYGLKIANTLHPDSGDWCISNTQIWGGVYDSDAAIRLESSGGGKIVNFKINDWNNHGFTHGIDLVGTPGISTIIMHISNSSIECISGNGINIVLNGAMWRSIIIMGCEFGLWGNADGHAIHMEADNIANTNGVIIGGNVFTGDTSTEAAISLDTINNVQIFGNTYQTFGSLLSQTDCTNVVTQ